MKIIMGSKENYNVNKTEAAQEKNFEEYLKKEKRIDLRNISLNEINELIKAGETSLLEFPPVISREIIEKNGGNIGAVKIDLLGQLESMLAFKKSSGESYRYIENTLYELNKLSL